MSGASAPLCPYSMNFPYISGWIRTSDVFSSQESPVSRKSSVMRAYSSSNKACCYCYKATPCCRRLGHTALLASNHHTHKLGCAVCPSR